MHQKQLCQRWVLLQHQQVQQGPALSTREVAVGPVVQQQLSGGVVAMQGSNGRGSAAIVAAVVQGWAALQQQAQAGAVALLCSQVQQAPAPCVTVLLVQPPGQQCLCHGCAALHCCHSQRCHPSGSVRSMAAP